MHKFMDDAMYKLVTFSGYDTSGPHIFPIEPDLDRTIGHIKMARSLPPSIEQYIRTAKPVPGKTQLLIDAMGAGEFYGCFPPGTLIQTARGEVPIESIEPGDRVLTHLNRFRPVRAVLPQKADELCDLFVQGLPSTHPALTATPNHELWAVLRDDFIKTKRRVIWKGDTSGSLTERRDAALREVPFSWVAISELRAGDMIAEPFPLEEDPLALGDAKWNTPEVAFLMGLYAAEGCVAYRYDRDDDEACKLVFVTGRHEVETHRRATECATNLGHKLTFRHSQKEKSTRLELSMKELAQLCLDHIGTPAEYKHLSLSVLRMPIGWQETFFNAYAGGDGCGRGPGSGKEEGSIRCVSASAGLLRGFRIMLARRGIAASISGRHNTKATWYSGRPIFELMISASQANGGRGCSKSYIHPSGYILSSVKKSLTYDWSGDVFDLSVEEDTSYVASGVAVHNSNVNGDYFPEAALRADGPDFGHKTFELYAYPFKHHVNKDPARAYGEKVTLSAYDPYMHRVLLIVSVDDAKCQDILGDLASNKYWDVSMGCRVPWDECSICRNRAKNRAEYCPHLRYQMNKILQDGRRVFAYNHLPKFFDISFVTIGAEKASHVLKKVAAASSTPNIISSAMMGELFYGKLAAQEKGATQLKEADIDKDVPSQPSAGVTGVTPEDKSKLLSFMNDAGEVKGMEAPIPPPVLDRLSEFPLESVFSTLASLGIGLRPQEFQRIVLIKQGARALANQLERERLVFDETKVAAAPPQWAKRMGAFSVEHLNEKVAMILAPYIRERSCYPEILHERLRRMEKRAGDVVHNRNSQWYPMTDEQKRKASGINGLVPASLALAAGFSVFNRAFPELMAKAPMSIQMLGKHPWMLPLLLGAGIASSVSASSMMADMPIQKHGSSSVLDAKNTRAYHEPKIASVARLGLIPLSYMYSGIQQKRWQRGEQLNALDRMIALRPELLALGSFLGGPSIVGGIKGIAKGLMKSGSESLDDAIINTTTRLAGR